MNETLHQLLDEIKEIESKIHDELKKNESDLRYTIKKRKVVFEKEAALLHKKLSKSVPRFLWDASLSNILTAPVIYSLFFPAIIMDLFVTVYQAICFPVYGIQKVKRKEHIIIDRHYLKYLNWIEKLNCCYCGYFNGLISYVQEIGGRTEQYWCPIKHARKMASRHSHYHNFFDYGDAESYSKRLDEIRNALIKNSESTTRQPRSDFSGTADDK